VATVAVLMIEGRRGVDVDYQVIVRRPGRQRTGVGAGDERAHRAAAPVPVAER
jgi:hypothetical protein